jgi:hypothetical protein
LIIATRVVSGTRTGIATEILLRRNKRLRTETNTAVGNGLAHKVCLKIGKLANKLNDLISLSITFDAITVEFASCLAVRNDTVCKKFTARAYSSVGRAADF